MDEEPLLESVSTEPASHRERMEVHPPHAPRHSFKDFALQLGTITSGVLIALFLEGLVEWNHNRLLVREARATIRREIAENKKDVDAGLGGADVRQSNIKTALRLANQLLETRASDVNKVDLGFSLAETSAAAWHTAERTGALAQMDYSEVQRYSRIYDAQALLTNQQRRLLERLAATTGILASGGSPHDALPKDLEVFRQQILVLGAEFEIERQLASRLSEMYKEALEQ